MYQLWHPGTRLPWALSVPPQAVLHRITQGNQTILFFSSDHHEKKIANRKSNPENPNIHVLHNYPLLEAILEIFRVRNLTLKMDSNIHVLYKEIRLS